MKKKDIEPNRYYSAAAVVATGLTHWKAKSTFCRALRDEKWAKVFRVITDRKETLTRFHIPGHGIINYIKLRDDGAFSEE